MGYLQTFGSTMAEEDEDGESQHDDGEEDSCCTIALLRECNFLFSNLAVLLLCLVDGGQLCGIVLFLPDDG